MRPPKPKAIKQLQKAIDAIPEVQEYSADSPVFEKWHRDTDTAIRYIFGEQSSQRVSFYGIKYTRRRTRARPLTDSEIRQAYVQGLGAAQVLLESFIEEIQECWEEQTIPGSPAAGTIQANTQNVFIIFGHDRANALELQKMLKTSWNLDAVMLEDYAGKSRTLIKKFEDVADTVNYTFALMTADDTVQKAEEDYDQARPNVLFELGWFCCKLTRSGVCLLFQKNTKIPSDLEGIERLEFDKSVKEQHAGIQAELKSAGLI